MVSTEHRRHVGPESGDELACGVCSQFAGWFRACQSQFPNYQVECLLLSYASLPCHWHACSVVYVYEVYGLRIVRFHNASSPLNNPN
jgi:hypothetical protein